MDRELVKVTPKKAEVWLNKNSLNRKLRDGWVEKYAADMKQGKWTECLAPIAFYEDGNIADGQHRLWAIIESQTTQTFYIVHNLPREAGFNIDTGGGRTLIDNARIAGVDSTLTNEGLAISRAVEMGDRSAKYQTHSQRYEQYNKHREAIEWVVQHGVKKGRFLKNSAVNGAIARAWYAEDDKDRLAMFAHVLATGLANGMEDSAAVTMRNYLLAQRASFQNGVTWRDAFLKIQNAIWYFMRRKKLLLIKTQGDEAYPLTKKKGRK